MEQLLSSELIQKTIPVAITLTLVSIFLWGVHWLLLGRNRQLRSEGRVPRQMAMIGLILAGLIVVIISLPIEDGLRNQIIGLIGIVLSGLVAFSSTNIIGNLMAGVLLRITKPFGIGDFVRVGNHFGRVSERGLFDTEIQSENRELIALPNSYLADNPVTTVHHSGAIVSATLSLGYEVHHKKVSPLLIEAAEKSGLSDAFVHIIELNDFSVSYRISGFLSEIKGLITARSNLLKEVLDSLHENNIEIMSPSFMNQRPQPPESTTIPKKYWVRPTEAPVEAEEIVFDKAEKAQQRSTEIKTLHQQLSELENELKTAEDERKTEIKEEITELNEQIIALKRTTHDEEHDLLKEEENEENSVENGQLQTSKSADKREVPK